MAASAPEHEDRGLSVGRVFSRGFGTITANPLPTLGLAFLFGAVPNILFAHFARLAGQTAVTELGPFAGAGIMVFSLVVSVVLAVVTQGALVRATVAHSEGRKSSFAESAMAGLRVAFPLVLLAIVSSIGIALGFLLLLVPGVILYVIWSVAAPALVEERIGPLEALGRSRYLTSGARWTIFGVGLVLIVLSWMLTGIMAVIISAVSGAETFAEPDYLSMPFSGLVAGALFQTLTSALWGVILSSLYVELRNWRDGPTVDSLAEVFG